MKIAPITVLLILMACSGAPKLSAGPAVPAVAPPPSPTGTQITAIAAGPGEYGSAYVAVHPSAARVSRVTRVQTSVGIWKDVPGCKVDGTVQYARTSELVRPTKYAVASDGQIPKGDRYLHIRLDQGDCYQATRWPAPVQPEQAWWMPSDGPPIDMASGGGSPQCSGECPWYTTLDL